MKPRRSIHGTNRHRRKNRNTNRLRIEPLESRQLLAVVINEIHVDPEFATEQVEFVELHNDSSSTIDISGWVIDDAVDYEFPNGSAIAPFGNVVVTQNAADFQSKFGFTADGEWELGDKLSNEGENIQLRDAAGQIIDEVDYQLGFPWPTVGEIGRSMELIHPSLDNNLAGSWRASGGGDLTEDTILLGAADSDWRYRPGTSEASSPIDAWRLAGFVENGSWSTGQTPVGYGDGDDNTVLNMQGNYTSVYLRNSFIVSGEIPTTLELNVYADDGAVVWINGTRVGLFHVADVELSFNDTAFNHEAEWETVTIPNAQQFLVAGENTIAIHGLNQSINSSDFSIDARVLIPAINSGIAPTPGQTNAATAVSAADAPPQLRQVTHTPEQPVGGEAVVVTMRATDPDGVQSLSLDYQLVNPGNYIKLTDAAYDTNWTTIPMNDDGTGGDAVAGDNIFSATIPGNLNTHRRLVRYRVTATDTLGNSVRVPYSDDPQPNFAYFVYDGVPDYTASLRPGVEPTDTYSGSRLDDMATYHLIANSTDVNNSQYNGSFNRVQFNGTLVYDGVVYDHIEFRNRGQGSTYQVGKNKWKLNFTRGHSFQARDDYGERYDEDWDKLNILPMTNPWWRNDISTEGTILSEPVAFKLYELAGTPSSNTQYFQFRVIDSANEAPANDQYGGDFWGLYVGIEQPDSSFLNERDLPDGNIFNLHSGTFGATTQRAQGSELPTDRSDLAAFLGGVNGGFTTAAQWEDALNLDSYFAWNITNQFVNNSDIRVHENVNYYHNQETGQWHILPWDLDLTFEDRPHLGTPVGNRENIRRVIDTQPTIQLQYENRLREITDLLLASGDAANVVDEYANILTANGTDEVIVESNQAMWDYHPRKNKQGIWYDNFNRALLPSQTFEGLVTYMKDFVSTGGYGYDLLQIQGDDSNIPNKPSVFYFGDPAYPRDQLNFLSSGFSDPNGNGTFAAMEWRLAEVYNDDVENYQPGEPFIYEIEGTWESGELTTPSELLQVTSAQVEVGKTYRVRVRMKDTSGHWSHWSDPHEFQAGEATDSAQSPLVISEISYNPSAPNPDELAEGFVDKDDFEFIELINSGTETITLADVRFDQVAGEGVEFDFATGAIADLAPGERVLVVEDQAAFEFRYGSTLPVAGQWSGGLGNGGELLTLSVDGNIQHQFAYDDGWYPETDGDGFSLQIIDATNDNLDDWADPNFWQASNLLDGSPGRSNTPGDFNEDSSADAHDIDLLCSEIGRNRDWTTYDLNGDLVVNQADFDRMILVEIGTLFGDANLDGVVDASDFNVWNANKFLSGTGWAGGNFNCDNVTDASDFNIWNANKFTAADVIAPSVIAPLLNAEESKKPNGENGQQNSQISQIFVDANSSTTSKREGQTNESRQLTHTVRTFTW